MNYLDKFKLNGKTCVVTGGSGLIGNEVCKALVDAGAKVYNLDVVEKDNGSEFVKFDITDSESYATVLKNIGKFDVFINIAYARTKDWGNKLEDVPNDSWKKNVDIQLNAYCLLTRDAAELMKKNKIKGSIINYGSHYGVVAPEFEIYPEEMTMPAAYAAIKGGVVNFSRYCASYYGKSGIRVNCLCPGGVENNQDPSFIKNYKKLTCLNRMATAEDMASATLFLASDASSYITGTTFMVDGGLTCK